MLKSSIVSAFDEISLIFARLLVGELAILNKWFAGKSSNSIPNAFDKPYLLSI
jgi:hypothetical protein